MFSAKFRKVDTNPGGPTAACDRCGQTYALAELVLEKHTGLMVDPGCLDPEPTYPKSYTDDVYLDHPRPPRKAPYREVTRADIARSQNKKQYKS